MNNDGNVLFSQVPTKMRHTNLKLTVKRGNMVGASRNLLLAVTRLLILADMINVHLLLKKLRRARPMSGTQSWRLLRPTGTMFWDRLDLSSKGINDSTVIFNFMYLLLLHSNPKFVMQWTQSVEVEEHSLVFTEHSNKLLEVANLACSMSANEDGVKMVCYAAQQIQNLCPRVKNLPIICRVITLSCRW